MDGFPHQIYNDGACGNINELTLWLAGQLPYIEAELRTHGAVLFRDFPVKSALDFDAFSATFGYEDFTYDESFSNAVRINLTPRVFTANEAPPDREIFLHHELAQTPFYPSKIFFCCLSAPESGGETPLCRSDLLFAEFKRQYPDWTDLLAELGLRYTIQMPETDNLESGQGRSWRNTLSVNSEAQAEDKLARLGYEWRWRKDQTLSATTPVMPAIRALSDGSASFFNQVIAVSRGWQRGTGTPTPLTFGDGTKIDDSILEALIAVSHTFSTALQWQAGDVALVDNFRVMHGRYPYAGKSPRQIIVNLAR